MCCFLRLGRAGRPCWGNTAGSGTNEAEPRRGRQASSYKPAWLLTRAGPPWSQASPVPVGIVSPPSSCSVVDIHPQTMWDGISQNLSPGGRVLGSFLQSSQGQPPPFGEAVNRPCAASTCGSGTSALLPVGCADPMYHDCTRAYRDCLWNLGEGVPLGN